MNEHSKSGVAGYLISGLMGLIIAIFVGMVTFGRTVITRDEMQQEIQGCTDRSEREIQTLRERVDWMQRQMETIDRRQQRVIQKLGIDGQ